ncbi:uncharacterized protein LOC123517962 isoform X3 [Portunus trituberculatus]|uniref:uncharacterized protein LOC123517962 isoform X3 n=1 Tax=Portunus trituberculatus TaxID=210409 RepID=UPI001E1CBD2C|nr:uncharacterized protein LOC123517962 isoform X3 [Portunus trituberculatus]
MGACIARCLPLYSDPRYQPVRSRYLIQDDVVQLEFLCQETEPSRASRLSARLGALFARLQPKAEDEVELTQRIEQPQDTSPQHLTPAARSGSGYGGAASVGGERWWGSALPGSLPSLAGGDSPPTNSLDLEWEPEAGLGRVSRESLGTGEEEASQTAESSSWVPRSACSTPNSLEWDFRASTLSLRGQGDEETWQTSDQETEQLLYEIEQLAARALADTGHGLQPPR